MKSHALEGYKHVGAILVINYWNKCPCESSSTGCDLLTLCVVTAGRAIPLAHLNRIWEKLVVHACMECFAPVLKLY